MGAGPKKIGVTSAVSDESVAGDSGVYEPSERRYKEFDITHCFPPTGASPCNLHVPTCDVLFPVGRASLQTSSWAPMTRGWFWAALRCSSASAMSPETNASQSTSCSYPTAAPSACRLTRRCTASFLFISSNVDHILKNRKKNLQVKQRNKKCKHPADCMFKPQTSPPVEEQGLKTYRVYLFHICASRNVKTFL